MGGSRNRATGCVGVARRIPDIEDRLSNANNTRVRELQLVGNPLVVGFRALDAEHHVFHPVREYPAGGGAGLDADTPRCLAVGNHLVAQCYQLIECRRDGITAVGEHLGVVPDDGLEVGLDLEGVDLVLECVGLERTGRPLRPDYGHDVLRDRQQEALGRKVQHLAGLREHCDVRRVTAGSLCVDLIREVTGTRVGDLDSRFSSKDVQRPLDPRRLVYAVLRREHGDGSPGKVCHRFGCFCRCSGCGCFILTATGCGCSLSRTFGWCRRRRFIFRVIATGSGNESEDNDQQQPFESLHGVLLGHRPSADAIVTIML